MFEKSLVDLIKGLRSHKGDEAEYIQNALKECRSEAKSQDMDLKATALLKLVYLEMFGYDMTWAAFNVLEVMSSPKLMQKRVGYLAAVQTMAPDTDVLMLAENLLKKDLTSPSIPVLSLPLVAIPHIVTSSLALSILTELLPRLSHSQPAVRKKTIVALYRLALVYPDTLKVAWPKIKERLMDPEESSSVTAASVNVVCELGWRSPQEFLSLAPRLFELLTSDKNNWMSIKIIKLFAVLTPVEPRLVKKLARPLAKILRETSAMSLLYECISGIIQGGILDGSDMGVDVEEVADLCITKLRGMIALDGDPNLKYVALLAFNKIVGTHPRMVSNQQDVIMKCLDDPDISIKMQALELVSGMVDSENLQSVVNRLIKQLVNAPKLAANGDASGHIEEEITDLEQRLLPDKRGSESAPIPDEYRYEIISRILDMCSNNNYANITDFEWYIDILLHLVCQLPSSDDPAAAVSSSSYASSLDVPVKPSLSARIGSQILDIAVRVRELRAEATLAAEKLVLLSNRTILFSSTSAGLDTILNSASWVCGEYASFLSDPHSVLNSLIHETSLSLAPQALSTFCQSIPKVLCRIVALATKDWSVASSTTLSLMLARTINFYTSLSLHSALEVQERAVEFLELLKLCSEALNALSAAEESAGPPLLLTTVLPSLFDGPELNPVSAAAQSKVPVPSGLDLDEPINPNLAIILADSQQFDPETLQEDAFYSFYHDREPEVTLSLQPTSTSTSYLARPPSPEEASSYQQAPDSPTTLARRKAERMARARDDPFYIAPSESGSNSPRAHNMSRSTTEAPDELDVDNIPIVDLQLDLGSGNGSMVVKEARHRKKKRQPRKFNIAGDETLDSPSLSDSPAPSDYRHALSQPLSRTISPSPSRPQQQMQQQSRPPRTILTVPSAQLSYFSLGDTSSSSGGILTAADLQRQLEEEKEMAAALAEVERKRLELIRDAERRGTTFAAGVDDGGAVVPPPPGLTHIRQPALHRNRHLALDLPIPRLDLGHHAQQMLLNPALVRHEPCEPKRQSRQERPGLR
ncbi:hypothetical protein DV735_g1169, partial [Chaetothyriales sp. CBS 134920]